MVWLIKASRVSWRQICLRDLRTWNKALLAKTLWNIHVRKDTLWVKWVNEFFLRGGSIWEWMPKPDTPPIFKNMVRIRDEMVANAGSIHEAQLRLEAWCNHKGLQVRFIYELINNGDNTDFVAFGTRCVRLSIIYGVASNLGTATDEGQIACA